MPWHAAPSGFPLFGAGIAAAAAGALLLTGWMVVENRRHLDRQHFYGLTITLFLGAVLAAGLSAWAAVMHLDGLEERRDAVGADMVERYGDRVGHLASQHNLLSMLDYPGDKPATEKVWFNKVETLDEYGAPLEVTLGWHHGEFRLYEPRDESDALREIRRAD